MLKQILNLDGAQELGKKEQKEISGKGRFNGPGPIRHCENASSPFDCRSRGLVYCRFEQGQCCEYCGMIP